MTTAAWRRDRAFYAAMALAIIASVFAGFARTYYVRSRFQSSGLPLYLRLHGVVFTTWIALFAVQIGLVAVRRTDVHRRLGWAGAVLASLMVPVALTAAIISGRREVLAGRVGESLTFFAVPVFSITVFVLLIASALYYRRRPDTHKRLMLLATISIMDAAVARWPLAFVASSAWAYYVLTDLFIAAAIIYDLASRRRVSGGYLWGGLLVVSAQLMRELVGPTSAWHAFASRILGQ